MKIETEAQAAIKQLQDCLDEIPFLQIITITKRNDTLYLVDLRIEDRRITVLAEYKSSGQPRLARQVVYELKDGLAKGQGNYGIFLAPYISGDAAAICKESQVGYFDLAGNCHFSFETVYVHREGNANPFVKRRELRSLYSSKAERILRVLLTLPNLVWTTKTLAETAQVSFGQVSNVKKMLADREWLDPNETGIRLTKPAAVLDEWAQQYKFHRNQVMDYYALSEVVESEYQLAEACHRQDMRFALTAFSGAARLAPAVRYQRVTAYVDGNPDALVEALGWKPVTSGANISLLVPYDEGVFYGSREMDGTHLATLVQIYLDLQSYRGRGQEAAQAIRKELEKSWQ